MHQQGEHAYSISGSFDAALIRAELEDLLASRNFAHANRLARFLRFVVEHHLSGEAARLKESVIGIEVYERSPDYDPKIDSIVRTEARRLRKKLQEYYSTDGRYARVVITIPTGAYVPRIEIREMQRPALVVLEQPSERSRATAEPGVRRPSRMWALAIVCSLFLGCAFYLAYAALSRRPRRGADKSNPQANRLYLEGRYFWSKRTPDAVHKAIERFAEALRTDPNNALAYSGLADSYAITASGLPSAERLTKARDAADRAVSLDDTSAEAHTSLAFVLYKSEWNWLEAERHFRRAIQLKPEYALAHQWFGEFLVLLGRFDQGLAELRQAQSLEPLSLPIKSDLARGLYRARHYDEAIAQSRSTLDLDADFQNAYATLVYSYEQKQDYAHAVQADLQVLRLSGISNNTMIDLERTYHLSGWRAYWREKANVLRSNFPPDSVPAYTFAEIHLRLGDRDPALRTLEESFQEHGDAPLLIGVDPFWDPLRSNTRFQYLLRRAGLPEMPARSVKGKLLLTPAAQPPALFFAGVLEPLPSR